MFAGKYVTKGASSLEREGDVYTVKADVGRPKGTYRRDDFSIVCNGSDVNVYDSQFIPEAWLGGAYTVSADLYMEKSVIGSLGLFYNAQNMENFDFVLFKMANQKIRGHPSS